MPEHHGPPGNFVLIGLGSNIGDRQRQIQAAIDHIGRLAGTEVLAVSAFYETQARFVEEQPDFVNACAAISTTLAPRALLDALLEIELALGRVRAQPKGPRTIDLDILLYGQEQLSEVGLQIPHPGLGDRAFVLVPLAEIAAEVRHPALGLTIGELARRCADSGWVQPLA